MNSLVIPPAPNWYSSVILACAPDNTIIYGARNEVVVVRPKDDENTCADVKIFPAHSQRVTSISINPNWGNPSKLAVSAGEDQIIRLWDIEECIPKLDHKGHTINQDRVIAAAFSGDDRVISCSESGFIIIWRLSTNTLSSLKNVFGCKVRISVMSPCPHASWLMSFGLENGLIFIVDLRKNGKIVHRLRGHDKGVVSISWCPTPFNVFPEINHRKEIKRKQKEPEVSSHLEDENILLIKEDKSGHEDELDQNVEKTSSTNDENVEQKSPSVKFESSSNQSNDSYDTSLDSSDPKLSSFSNKVPDILVEEVDEKNIIVKKATHLNGKTDDDQTKCQEVALHIERTSVEVTEKGESNNQEIGQGDSRVVNLVLECCTKEFTETIKDSGDGIVQEKNSDNGMNSNRVEDLEEKENQDSKEVPNISDDNILHDKNVNFEHIDEPGVGKEYFLASSSKAGTICIWKAGFCGRLYTELNIFSKQHHGYKKREYSDKIWISLCWVKANILLSSSQHGELLHWDLLHPTNDQNKYRLIHHDHSKIIFCIAAALKVVNSPSEINASDQVKVWTIGQDRILLSTNIGTDRKNYFCLPTIGGNVCCFASSPLDPTRIAIGFGDGTSKIWDLSRAHFQYITMVHLWQKINGRVTSLAWHPTKELLLAYGTSEGRVATVDTYNASKLPNLQTHCFKTDIYNVEWGPFQSDVNNMGLYVCSSGKLVVYNTNKPLNDPSLIVGNQVTSFNWKSDHSILAVGIKTGEVMLYKTDLCLLSSLYLLKCIKYLSWHPIDLEDKSSCNYSNWLAIVTNESSFYIYNCEMISDLSVNPVLIATLNGHNKSIKAVAWSPHEFNKIVSVGEDGIAMVWNVEKEEILSTFNGHNFECILSVIWSPLDKDFVITGGKDNAIRIWKVSEHPPLKENFVNLRRKYLNTFKLSKIMNDNESDVCEKTVKFKNKQDSVLKLITNLHNNNLLVDCKRLLDSHFMESEEVAGDSGESDNIDCLDLFKGTTEVFNLLELERKNHEKRVKPFCEQNISLWMGDITESIKKAIQGNCLTPWLISLAPMASPKLWYEACETYAKQLLENPDGDPLETVSYLLACHKVEEAIDVLVNAALFREALAIAKVRLQHNDVIVKNIFEKWTVHCIYTGHYEVAAQIFIYFKQYEEAAKVLYKRSDCETLSLAVELAEKAGNKELYEAVLARYKLFEKNKKLPSLPNASEALLENKNGVDSCKSAIDEERKETETNVENIEKLPSLPNASEALLENKNGTDSCKSAIDEERKETETNVQNIEIKETDHSKDLN